MGTCETYHACMVLRSAHTFTLCACFDHARLYIKGWCKRGHVMTAWSWQGL